MSENEIKNMALRKFLRDARQNSLTCYSCAMIHWLTRDSCPSCGTEYPANIEDRKNRQVMIFQEYEETANARAKYGLFY